METSQELRNLFLSLVGTDEEKMLQRLHFSKEVNALPHDVRIPLLEVFDSGQSLCSYCDTSLRFVKDWTFCHLCDRDCVIVPTASDCSSHHSCSEECLYKTICKHEYVFVCNTCKPRLVEKHFLENIYRFRTLSVSLRTHHSKDTFLEDHPVLGLKLRIYQKLRQHHYLKRFMKKKTSFYNSLQNLWEEFEKNNFLCMGKQCSTRFTGTEKDKKVYLVHQERVCVVCDKCRHILYCTDCQTVLTRNENKVVVYENYEYEDNSYDLLPRALCVPCFILRKYPERQVEAIVSEESNLYGTQIISCETSSGSVVYLPSVSYSPIIRDISSLRKTDSVKFPTFTIGSAGMTPLVISSLYTGQNGCCTLCHAYLTFSKTNYCAKSGTDLSINRIDNSLPHISSNLDLTCWSCNERYRSCKLCKISSLDRRLFSVFGEETYCLPCCLKTI
jgi:hypothetical protein